MPVIKPREFRGRARRDTVEHHGGVETEEKEAAAPDVAMEGEEGGGPGARMPLATVGRSSGRWR
jgi:hypothetical protein